MHVTLPLLVSMQSIRISSANTRIKSSFTGETKHASKQGVLF